MSINRQHLYAGMSNGRIRVYGWRDPAAVLVEQPVYIEYAAHVTAVVSIQENLGRTLLISSAEDGTVFIHAITAVVTAASTVAGEPTAEDAANASGNEFAALALLDEPAHYHTGTVLMSVDDIEEHIGQICDLQKKVQDTTSMYI